MIILFKKLWNNPTSRIGVMLLLLVIFFSFVIPVILQTDPNLQVLEQAFHKPNFEHLFGTDNFGRDVFLRIIHGSRLSLIISLSATSLAVFIGIVVGIIAGIASLRIQSFLMRITDLFMAFPKYFIFILLLGFSNFSILKIVLVFAFFSWMEIAKIICGEINFLKTTIYYKTAKCHGLSIITIIFYHILPNLTGAILSGFSLMTASMIILESGVSFIGLGVQSPGISLGIILNQARYFPVDNLSLILFSGLFIVLDVAAFHMLGDGLKSVLDKEKYNK